MSASSARSDNALPRQTQTERRALSERKLFDALASVVLEKGISAATCEAIAKKAGYSRGLTTTRLGKRSEMFGKLVERCVEAQKSRLAACVDDDTPGLEALRLYVDLHFDDLANDSGYNAYFVLVAGSLSEAPLLKASVATAIAFAHGTLAGFVRRGQDQGSISMSVDPDELAFTIGRYLLGSAIAHRLSPERDLNPARTGAYGLLPEHESLKEERS